MSRVPVKAKRAAGAARTTSPPKGEAARADVKGNRRAKPVDSGELPSRPGIAPKWGGIAPSGAAPLEFTRYDWTEFRDPSRLSARAGVTRDRFPNIAVKELTDNGLDAGGAVTFGLLERSPGLLRFYVADAGAGIPGDDADLADRFSIRRELRSSKTLKMPTRGMLGNGLRVVAGVVCCSGGELRVSTGDRTLTLVPNRDTGATDIRRREEWVGTGTRVVVTMRGAMADDADLDTLFDWAQEAVALSTGDGYKGGSSGWWYTSHEFHELAAAAGAVDVTRLVKQLAGCSGRAKEIAGGLAGRACDTVTGVEAAALLGRVRAVAPPVKPARLGKVGPRADFAGYARTDGEVRRDGARVPFVVEAWANRADEPGVTVCVNRTPIVTRVKLVRQKGDYAIFGAGLENLIPGVGRKGSEFRIVVNVTTPSIPLTSSGKDPDLRKFLAAIIEAVQKAIRRAKRNAPAGGTGKPVGSQKQLIRDNLTAATESLSGGGRTIFSLRQLFYWLRPLLISMLGREPNYDTFSAAVGEIEDAQGDVPELYRDNRGTLYHPHTREEIPLGTRSVGRYQRPEYTFNKVLYCEKEGFFPILKAARFPERYDCALLTSKGFATRAAREVLRQVRSSAEPVEFYCVHDADGPGTVIHQALADSLAEEGITVHNLGLEPAEARAMGLQVEPVRRKNGARVPVGRHVPPDDAAWLQRNRVELNAMTTPQFLEWLEGKFSGAAKVIPPDSVIAAELGLGMREVLTRRLTDEAVRSAGVHERVDAAIAARQVDLARLAGEIAADLPAALGVDANRARSWKAVVRDRVADLIE